MFAFYNNLSRKQSVTLLTVKGIVLVALAATLVNIWFS